MDVYPNNSEEFTNWTPEAPEDRKEQEEKERTKVSTSIGVIRDVLDWFDSNAEVYASVDALNINEETDPTAALVAMNTAKKMRAAFQSKAMEFRNQFAQYLEEEKE